MKQRILQIVDKAVEHLETVINGIDLADSTAPADLLACLQALNLVLEIYEKDTD